MNRSQIIELYDQDQRIDMLYPDMRREVTPDVVRHIGTREDGQGLILYSRLTGVNAEDVIREQVRYFEAVGQDFEWKLYDYDPPTDLKERLAAFGFIIEEAEAVLVLDLDKAPEVLRQPARHTIRRISTLDDLSDVLSIYQQVWGDDVSSLGEYLKGALRDYPDQMSLYAAYLDGQPAGTARIFFPPHSQFGSIWGGATLSAFRRRGLFTDLLAAQAQEACARDVRFLTADAMPMSRPILESLGFERIAWTYPCKWNCRAPQR